MAVLSSIPLAAAPETHLRVGQIALDPRLQGRVECRVPGRSVETFLQEAAAATGVSLSADQECRDQKLIVAASSIRVGEVLALLERHFEFRWTALPPAGNTVSPGYRLTQTRARRTLGADLRAATEREHTERVLRRLELRLRFLDASPAVLAGLRDQDPFIGDLATHGPLRASLRLVSLLRPAQRRGVAGGQPFLSPPLATLPAQVQELAERAAGPKVGAGDKAQLRYTVRLDTENGADHLTLRVIGSDGRPVGSGSDLTFTEPPRTGSGTPLGRAASDPKRRPNDPSLNRVTELVDEKGRPLPITAELPVLLAALSRATGLKVLSDYYSGQRLRFDAETLGRRPLWQILNILGSQYSLAWRRSGSHFLFRHQEWYVVELEEIPERLLNLWRTGQETPGRVPAAEYLRVLSALTPEQMDNLRFQFPGVFLNRPFPWEQFWGSFNPEERESLLAGQIIPGTKRVAAARERLLARFPRAAPPPRIDASAIRVRLRETNGTLNGSVEAAGDMMVYQAQLPLKRPLLPSVAVLRLSARVTPGDARSNYSLWGEPSLA